MIINVKVQQKKNLKNIGAINIIRVLEVHKDTGIVQEVQPQPSH